MSNFKWIIRASRGVRLEVLTTLLIGIMQVFSSLTFIWLTKRTIDIAIDPIKGVEVRPYLYSLVACVVVQLLLYIARIYLDEYSQAKLRCRLKSRIFGDILVSEWCGFSRHHTGDLVNRLEDDLNSVSGAIAVVFPSLVVVLVQMFASFIFIYSLEANLAWVLLLSMPVVMVLSRYYIPKMRRLTSQVKSLESESTAFIQERLQRRVIINSICRAEMVKDEFSELMGRLFNQSMRRTCYSIFSRSAVQFGFYAGYLIAFIWGINGMMSHAITFGTLSAFLQLVYQVQRPIVEIASKSSNLSRVIVAVDRLSELSDLDTSEQSSSNSQTIIEGDLGVRISSMSFCYPNGSGKRIFESLSYDFTPSSFHLIMGETGSGKSTLIRLMLGMLTPLQGGVEIYNRDESHTVSQWLRANFTYVPQGNSLSSGTIRSNLLMGNPYASESELYKALHTAVADFVLELDRGLDTPCGEQGEGFSEGEAQRIVIARALLQRGSIILLDEPTSALDSQTERLLVERLQSECGTKTIVMVTHKNIENQVDITSILKL